MLFINLLHKSADSAFLHLAEFKNLFIMFTKLFNKISDKMNLRKCEKIYAQMDDACHAESLQMDVEEYEAFKASGLSYREWMDANYVIVRNVRTTAYNPVTGKMEEYFEPKEFKYSEIMLF